MMKKELSKTKGGSSDTSKKFLKQSEVEEQRKAAYLAEQRALEEERQRKAAAKRKREDEIAAENAAREEKRRKLAEESRKLRQEKEEEEERQRRKRLGLPELAKPKNGENTDGADENDVPEEELQKGLRAIGEPYIVFGESHAARMRRYKRLTTVMSAGPIPTTLALVEEKDMRVDGTVPKDKQGRQWLFRQLASYFTMVLAAYERAMDEERNDTGASKQAYATMVQTRENMKPVGLPIPDVAFLCPAFFLFLTLFLIPLLSPGLPLFSLLETRRNRTKFIHSSFSEDSNLVTSTTPSSSPSCKSSKLSKKDATSTPTTTISD